MAKKKPRAERSEPAVSPAAGAVSLPSPRRWAALVAIAAGSACLSVFLWMELVLLRSGGSAFCAGAGGGLDCSRVWNGGFASAVHRLTVLPVAAWGLVWSVAAFALPLAGLVRASEGRDTRVPAAGTRWTAAAGAAGVLVMIVASLAAGALCVGCLATDLLVAAYAFTALSGAGSWLGLATAETVRGIVAAATVAAAAFLVLLYPGIHTPRASGQAGREAIAAASMTSSSPASSSSVSPAAPAAAVPAATGTGDPAKDRSLTELVASLDPPLKQTLADSLAIYRASAVHQLPAPRTLVGSDLARVRITEFTDILCEHCASLQETLKTIRANVPPGSFAVDARQFPLAGKCNPTFQPGEKDDVRCLAAKVRICAEPTGKEPAVADALFAKQQGLTPAEAMRIAEGILPKSALGPCLDSAATADKLDQDIRAASQFDSDGTPIVAVNGRKGTSFGPFLYAMVLTGGNPYHPAFESLPPGNPAAHLH